MGNASTDAGKPRFTRGSTWQVHVALNPGDDRPLFVQISRQIVAAILDGRLPGGAALPGSRTLATGLAVHRNTVLAAYDELFAEGWVTRAPARGTFVVEDLSGVTQLAPAGRLGGAPRREVTEPAFPVPEPVPLVQPPAYGPDQLVLSRGAPDVRLFPRADLLRAYRRVLARRVTSELTYADPRGHLPLREAVAQMLASRRGLLGGPDTVMVTRGSQMALMLVAQGLLNRGAGSRSRSWRTQAASPRCGTSGCGWSRSASTTWVLTSRRWPERRSGGICEQSS